MKKKINQWPILKKKVIGIWSALKGRLAMSNLKGQTSAVYLLTHNKKMPF